MTVRVALGVEQLARRRAWAGSDATSPSSASRLPGRGVDVSASPRGTRAPGRAALHAASSGSTDRARDPAAPAAGALRRVARHRAVRTAHGGSAPSISCTRPSLAVPPSGGVPLVVTAHDAAPVTMPETFTAPRPLVPRARVRAPRRERADVVITVSEFSADEIARTRPIPRERHPGRAQRRRPRARDAQGGQRTLHTFGLDDPPVRVLARHVAAAQERAGAGRRVRRGRSDDGRPAPARARWRVGVAGRRRGRGARARRPCALARPGAGDAPVGAVRRRRPVRVPEPARGLRDPRARGDGAAAPRSSVRDIPALREVAGDAACFVPPDDVDAWAERARRAPRRRGGARGARRARRRARAAVTRGSAVRPRPRPSTARSSTPESAGSGVVYDVVHGEARSGRRRGGRVDGPGASICTSILAMSASIVAWTRSR